MKVEDTFIEGLKIIHLNIFSDIRGSFIKVYNDKYFQENDLATNLSESYFSVSRKDVIRGMHFQSPPFDHTKLVFINNGSILDVVIDIRSKSKTFGRFFKIELTSAEPKMVYIPVGCAHGFLSLEDDSIVSYFQSSVYNEICDGGIKYNSFGMNWGIENPILSERDKMFGDFRNFISPF